MLVVSVEFVGVLDSAQVDAVETEEVVFGMTRSAPAGFHKAGLAVLGAGDALVVEDGVIDSFQHVDDLLGEPLRTNAAGHVVVAGFAF